MDSEIVATIMKIWRRIPRDDKAVYAADYLIALDPGKPDEMRYHHAYLFLRRYLATHTHSHTQGGR